MQTIQTEQRAYPLTGTRSATAWGRGTLRPLVLTLVGLAGLWKGQTTAAAEGQSGPNLGPSGSVREVIPPVVS